MPFLAAALPFIIGGAAIASGAVSIIQAIKGPPEMPSNYWQPKEDRSRQALEAAYAQAQALRQRRGASSTILTSPLGVAQPPQTVHAQLGG